MKRLVSVIVALILVLSCTEPMVDVRAAGARILAPFKSGYIPNDGSITLRLKPGFEFIRAGSEYLNWELALTGAALCKEVFEEEAITETMAELGYQKTKGTYYPTSLEEGYLHPSAFFGYRRYLDNKRANNVFAIVVRGTYGFADVVTDILDGGLAYFEQSTSSVLDEFMEFALAATGKTYGELKKDNNYFYITGYSLGGGVANRLSITDTIVDLAGKDQLTEEEYKNRIYTYTYESPHTCKNYFWMDPKGMSNAYNFKDVDDAVANSPLWPMATRYGTDLEYSVGYNPDSLTTFKAFLAARGISYEALRRGTDIMNQIVLQRTVENLDDSVFRTLFPNAKGGSVTEAPMKSNYGYDSIWGGHHDMGLPLTYIVQKGIEAGVWKSIGDVLVSTQGMQPTSQKPTLPLKAENLSWTVEPTYDYDDVEPIWAKDFADHAGTAGGDVTDGKEYLIRNDAFWGDVFEEMSFPLYSCLDEYYYASKGDASFVFYMPDRIDSGNFAPSSEESWEKRMRKPYVNNGGGMVAYTSKYTSTFNEPWGEGIWSVLRYNSRYVLGNGCFAWVVEKGRAYFDWDFLGPRFYLPMSELCAPLHKPYPVYQAELRAMLPDHPSSRCYLFSLDPHYAFVDPNGELITDFLYDETGTFSEGICAVSRDGKWGYIDESGREITELTFDAIWETAKTDYDEETNEYMNVMTAYPCTSDTIVVSRDGEMGVLYRDGTLLIDYGQLEDLAPAWNNELWAKQDGKWGLIDLAAAKRSVGLPEWEVAQPWEG